VVSCRKVRRELEAKSRQQSKVHDLGQCSSLTKRKEKKRKEKKRKEKKPDKEKLVTLAFNRFTRDVVRMIV